MKNISFLIGSGFSVPEGFPTTSEINNKLKAIDASTICIHTSGEAWFLEGVTYMHIWGQVLKYHILYFLSIFIIAMLTLVL